MLPFYFICPYCSNLCFFFFLLLIGIFKTSFKSRPWQTKVFCCLCCAKKQSSTVQPLQQALPWLITTSVMNLQLITSQLATSASLCDMQESIRHRCCAVILLHTAVGHGGWPERPHRGQTAAAALTLRLTPASYLAASVLDCQRISCRLFLIHRKVLLYCCLQQLSSTLVASVCTVSNQQLTANVNAYFVWKIYFMLLHSAFKYTAG